MTPQDIIINLTIGNLRWQQPSPAAHGLPRSADCRHVFRRMAEFVRVDFDELVDAHHEAAIHEDQARAGQLLLVELDMDFAGADVAPRECVSISGEVG